MAGDWRMAFDFLFVETIFQISANSHEVPHKHIIPDGGDGVGLPNVLAHPLLFIIFWRLFCKGSDNFSIYLTIWNDSDGGPQGRVDTERLVKISEMYCMYFKNLINISISQIPRQRLPARGRNRPRASFFCLLRCVLSCPGSLYYCWPMIFFGGANQTSPYNFCVLLHRNNEEIAEGIFLRKMLPRRQL